MGMFDEITCAYPMPDGIPAWVQNAVFQTKTFDRVLEQLHIDTDGYVMHEDGTPVMVHDWHYTGIVTFYTSNTHGIQDVRGNQYVDEGEEPYSIRLAAKVVDGQVVDLVILKEEYHDFRDKTR